MERSFPFNAVITDGVADRVYTAEDFAAERAAFVSNGITAREGLLVSAPAAGGMAIDIAVGAAVIDGHTYFNTVPLALPVAAADAALPRVDTVVLRLDREARTMHSAVKTGTPAENPAAPVCTDTVTVHEIPLAEISVAAGVATIAEADITDRRVRADYILSRLEIDEMVAEYKAAIEAFFTETDAEKLAFAADIFRTDAGAEKVLCGDGAYRDMNAAGRPQELVRFTKSGTFCPADYPTKDGRYTIEVQGGGGSGGFGAYGVIYAGNAGGYERHESMPLDSTKTYTVTVGAGGVALTTGQSHTQSGKKGGDSAFEPWIHVPGGKGGSGNAPTAVTVGTMTVQGGTLLVGGSSPLGAGGHTGNGAGGEDGGIGAGGGASTLLNTPSGKGGDGIVIISGYPL